MKIINKVAFLVHEPTMYAHYSSVWAEMARTDFAIILLQKFNKDVYKTIPGAKDFLDKIIACGYEFYSFEDLVRDKIKFKYVTNPQSCNIGNMSVFRKVAILCN